MANLIFIADPTIPGLGAAEITRRASDGIYTGAAAPGPASQLRRALRGLNRGTLQDIGLDGSVS